MKMNNYIDSFADHLEEALSIGEKMSFNKPDKEIKNVLICGLGGSGIGGSICMDIIKDEIAVPVISSKDYSVPCFVNSNTLVIVSSYSGNTEETLSALKKCEIKNAEICIITSGGELKKIAEKNNYNHIIIPGGNPPRAMFGYSFTQLFFVLNYYNLIAADFKFHFQKAVLLINVEKKEIKKLALNIAEKLFSNTPIVYVADGFEGVATRLRQQINENSKMLCWHHVVPEMNHNEVLGWKTNIENLAVIFLRNKCDYNRNKIRIDITKDIIKSYTNNITEVWSKGDSLIENTLYHINFGDWVSWYLSEMNCVDATEIDVINHLKSELKKV